MFWPPPRSTRFFIATLGLAAAALSGAQTGASGVRAIGEVNFITESASSTAPVVQAAGSGRVSVALRSDGTVVCWGVTMEKPVPYGLIGVKQVDVTFGGSEQLGLMKDGTVTSWGKVGGYAGTIPSGMSGVTQIAVGSRHVAALKSNGTVVCWGGPSPVSMTAVPAGLSNVVRVSAGSDHTLALKSDGTVVKWGINGTGVPGGLTGVVDISAGVTHDIAVKSDGTVVCWGTGTGSELTPPAGLTGVVQVAAGNGFSAALKSDGTVVSWGPAAPSISDATGVVKMNRGYGNVYLIKADGTLDIRGPSVFGVTRVPFNVGRLIGVSSGIDHSAVLRLNGTVFCFGRNDYGQIDPPEDLTGVTSVSVGQYFTAALKSDGTVVCWGRNDFGQCNVPSGLTGVVSVTAGPDFVVAAKSDGTLAAWGNDLKGVVSGAASQTGIAAVAANNLARYVIARKTDGTVVQWGDSMYVNPTLPSSLTNVVQVAASEWTGIALLTDGTVVSWGNILKVWDTPGKFISGDGRDGLLAVRTNRNRFVRLNAATQVDIQGIALGSGSGCPINYIVSGEKSNGGVMALPNVTVSTTTYKAIRGATVTGNVFLPNPAPAGGANVTLVTSDVGVAVPGTVTVPAGERSLNFTVTVDSTATLGVSTISATYGNYTSIAALTVVPSPLASVSMPSPVYGKQPVNGTITLSSPAPPGYAVNLTSTSTDVKVPDKVKFAAEALTATFPITTSDVAAVTSATVTVSDTAGGSASGSITVKPNGPISLTFSPTTAVGGSTTEIVGTVTLATPVTTNKSVLLSVTAGGDAATVPASVSILAGSATGTFTVSHHIVGANTTVTVAANRVGVTVSKSITLTPNKLTTITMSPSTIVGGSKGIVTGTVKLSSFVSQNTPITLTSSDPSLASVPATVTIPAGQRSATFTVSHQSVDSTTPVTITATCPFNSVNTSLSLSPNALVSATLNRTSVVGGSSTTVRLTLHLAEPMRTATVLNLASSDSSVVSVPATANVPSGSRTVTVTLTHFAVSETKTITLSATKGSTTVTVDLTVTKA